MRRMIDPETIIKSQIADDKQTVDLNEILEKYGTQGDKGNTWAKSVTLQIYSKLVYEDITIYITSDTDTKAYIIPNGAITITKDTDNDFVYISGLIVDNLSDMNLLRYIDISDGDYENGIILLSSYPFDVHVIKV